MRWVERFLRGYTVVAVVVVVVIERKRARLSHTQPTICRRFLEDGRTAHDVDDQRPSRTPEDSQYWAIASPRSHPRQRRFRQSPPPACKRTCLVPPEFLTRFLWGFVAPSSPCSRCHLSVNPTSSHRNPTDPPREIMPPKKGNQGSSSSKVKEDKVRFRLTLLITPTRPIPTFIPITDIRYEKRELPSHRPTLHRKLTTDGAVEKPIYKSPETGSQHPEATGSGW